MVESDSTDENGIKTVGVEGGGGSPGGKNQVNPFLAEVDYSLAGVGDTDFLILLVEKKSQFLGGNAGGAGGAEVGSLVFLGAELVHEVVAIFYGFFQGDLGAREIIGLFEFSGGG